LVPRHKAFRDGGDLTIRRGGCKPYPPRLIHTLKKVTEVTEVTESIEHRAESREQRVESRRTERGAYGIVALPCKTSSSLWRWCFVLKITCDGEEVRRGDRRGWSRKRREGREGREGSRGQRVESREESRGVPIPWIGMTAIDRDSNAFCG
jgi:hypothetical protein